MNYKEFFNIIKSGNMSGVYFLYGGEEYIKDFAAQEIIETYVSGALKEMNTVKMDGSECELYQIENAILTLPMMAQKRIVIVNDYNLTSAKNESEADEQTSLEDTQDEQKPLRNTGKSSEIKKMISSCPAETILLFLQRGEAKASAINLFDKNKVVEFTFPMDTEKRSMLIKMAAKEGLEISERNIDLMIEYTSMELLELDNEIKKLKAYVKEKEVKPQDIYDICIAGTDYNVFQMLRHISNKNGASAIAVYRNLLLDGQSPQAIISMIQRQYRALFYMDEIKKSDKDYKEIAKKLKTSDFIVKNMERLSGKLSKQETDNIAQWCADADYYVKKGKISIDNSAEMLIMKLINI